LFSEYDSLTQILLAIFIGVIFLGVVGALSSFTLNKVLKERFNDEWFVIICIKVSI